MKNVRAPINQSNFIHHNREKQIGSYQRHDYSTGKVPRLSQSQRLEEPQSPNRSLPPSSAYTKGSSVVVKQKGNSFRERERWIQREVPNSNERNKPEEQGHSRIRRWRCGRREEKEHRRRNQSQRHSTWTRCSPILLSLPAASLSIELTRSERIAAGNDFFSKTKGF